MVLLVIYHRPQYDQILDQIPKNSSFSTIDQK
nr:MAG TPA: hypothetical protein [Caudoviricetes sp.]